MPAYFASKLGDFIDLSPETIIGTLTLSNSQAHTRFQLPPEAVDSWSWQVQPLQIGVSHFLNDHPEAFNSWIFLEYPIPLVGKRIDAVILLSNIIVVIEVKSGQAPSSAVRQVEDYALNLACFHEACVGRRIIPVVLASVHAIRTTSGSSLDDLIEKTVLVKPTDLGAALKQIATGYMASTSTPVTAESFNNGRFKPIPRIIDAAVALYNDMDVFEIGHACAPQESLHRTTSALIEAVTESKIKHQKTICFVTGVPGAGKTLVGLNAIHDPAIRMFGSFLSGNGPLVKIIQEALIRDSMERSSHSEKKITVGEARLRVKTFIHNVHQFINAHENSCPISRVVVFDEAQRAWDSIQNEKPRQRSSRSKADAQRQDLKREGSEPETMLRIMDRHEDWAVIIALVGGGQEINTGEAGLAEWGRSLKKYPEWQVLASPEILAGDDSTAGFRLFEEPDTNSARVHSVDDLHLNTSIRSIRAREMSQWVNALLNGEYEKAHRAAARMHAKPLVCRDLEAMRHWLREARRGSTRSGLVASSSASRLRAHGIETSFEFQNGFKWDHWFLDVWQCADPICKHRYCNDVRSSSTLEVAGTQFKIQGLELDWVGLCWGEDLVWTGLQWQENKFSNKAWKRQKDAQKAAYIKNAYRVLLTRARLQTIIYVPQPESNDPTRLRQELDTTADWLIQCGALYLHSLGERKTTIVKVTARPLPERTEITDAAK
jgi:hypothetical protein